MLLTVVPDACVQVPQDAILNHQLPEWSLMVMLTARSLLTVVVRLGEFAKISGGVR